MMNSSDTFPAKLLRTSHADVHKDHPMSRECSFQLGGKAQYFCKPRDPRALQATLQLCLEARVLHLLIGGGANLLFRDEGFPGVVISTANLTNIEPLDPTRIRLGAGLSNAAFTDYTLKNNLTGFEWATDLPGSLGGGIYMNAKCYDACFSNIVSEVKSLAPDGIWHVFSKSQCGFDYKQSIFQKNRHIIVETVLDMAPGETQTISREIDRIRQDRKTKGQFAYPSAGCVFKNDYAAGIPSGQLIELCGLKGHRIGNVKVYEEHANFIVNLGNGKTQDVVALMQLIEQKVWEKHHVRLEPEIRIVP